MDGAAAALPKVCKLIGMPSMTALPNTDDIAIEAPSFCERFKMNAVPTTDRM